MSNPASSTLYLLQSTMLLYTRAHARPHAQRNISETPTLLADAFVLLHGCSLQAPMQLLHHATHASVRNVLGATCVASAPLQRERATVCPERAAEHRYGSPLGPLSSKRKGFLTLPVLVQSDFMRFYFPFCLLYSSIFYSPHAFIF